MPTTSPPIPPIPPPSVPLVDPKTGLLVPDWYRFLKALRDVAAKIREEIP